MSLSETGSGRSYLRQAIREPNCRDLSRPVIYRTAHRILEEELVRQSDAERVEPGAGGHHEESHCAVLGARPADLRIKALSIDTGDDGAAFAVNDVDFSINATPLIESWTCVRLNLVRRLSCYWCRFAQFPALDDKFSNQQRHRPAGPGHNADRCE